MNELGELLGTVQWALVEKVFFFFLFFASFVCQKDAVAPPHNAFTHTIYLLVLSNWPRFSPRRRAQLLVVLSS